MKIRPKHKKLITVLTLVVFVCALAIAGAVYYHSRHGEQKVSSKAIMAVKYQGGLCANGPCSTSVSNLFSSGTFEGHKKLNSTEVSQLQDITNNTDFLKYQRKTRTNCPSYSDGLDQVLVFPQKYGDREFVPCTLDIPKDDAAFTYINAIIESHSTGSSRCALDCGFTQ